VSKLERGKGGRTGKWNKASYKQKNRSEETKHKTRDGTYPSKTHQALHKHHIQNVEEEKNVQPKNPYSRCVLVSPSLLNADSSYTTAPSVISS
jgi:hypothetical protein